MKCNIINHQQRRCPKTLEYFYISGDSIIPRCADHTSHYLEIRGQGCYSTYEEALEELLKRLL